MRKLFFSLTYISALSSGYSQSYNLCGIWLGQNYSCYTIDEHHMVHPYVMTEIIEIKQEGMAVTATKMQGDDCVTSGNISWYGDYTSNTFGVTFIVGSPMEPNSVSIPNQTVFVIDSNRLGSTAGPLFIRATCSQIDSMGLGREDISIDCLECDFTPDVCMPNIFTPNGDGINDRFIPLKYTGIKQGTLSIYNRWGTRVFVSQKPLKGWNGFCDGLECMDGTYYWVVDYLDKNNKTTYFRGFVTLIQ